MAKNYIGFSKGEWVVRKADLERANGDNSECEWLLVTDVDMSGAACVTIERYDDEGDVIHERLSADSLVSTGTTEPDDMDDMTMKSIARLCPDLTEEEWDCVRGMMSEA